ncbi:MAG: hypothetical protein Q4G50_11470 [Corynebacterium sp.]|uniref:hypothetical protein n=1 Tax=Corynebacterium sp. TaxID=1720 RepID=UPI0026DEDB83|nr:hypothetical protein [Corynebacterium sp.]MDO5670607.1 hypothetical protein [Corynebacterium sp.]
MISTNERLSPSKAPGLWLLAALIGAVVQLLLTPAVFGWQGYDLFPEVEGVDRSIFLLLWLIVGALALLGFAWTLLRGPSDRMTSVDALVIFCGMSSPLGLVAAVYTLAMVTSWRRWRPIIIGFATGAVGAMLDVRLLAKTAPGPDVYLGALLLLVVAAVIGVWWGRRRQAVGSPAPAVSVTL